MSERSLWFLSLALSCAAVHAAQEEPRSVHFATRDGVRLHYLDAGTGPAVVFVPGWMVPGRVWQPQIEHFRKKFRVIAFDPRSQGESEQVTEGHYPERRAADIRDLIVHLRVRPVLLVGHSMAVGELLSYVGQFGTQDLAGIVLVDATLGPEPATGEAAQFFAFAGAIARDRAAFIEQNQSYFFRKAPPPEYLQPLMADVMRVPTTTALALLVGSTGVDHLPALEKLDKPVLYAITPAFRQDAEMLRSVVPGARIEVFEEAGHALFVDEPERFNRLLEEFARSAFAR